MQHGRRFCKVDQSRSGRRRPDAPACSAERLFLSVRDSLPFPRRLDGLGLWRRAADGEAAHASPPASDVKAPGGPTAGAGAAGATARKLFALQVRFAVSWG